MPRRVELPCPALSAAYRAGRSTTQLARRYHCSPTTIAKRLRACGITLRPSRFQPLPVSEALLRHMYLEERLPIAAIAAALGVSVSTVGNLRRRWQIPRRTARNAM